MTNKNNLFIILQLVFIMAIISGCSSKTSTLITIPSQLTTIEPDTLVPSKTKIIISAPPTQSYTATPTDSGILSTETPTQPKSLVQLTYVSNQQDGLSSVYAIDVYCLKSDPNCFGNPHVLFEWNDWISGIDWSPDGNKITFSSGLYLGLLYIADRNGENAEQITKLCGTADWPEWSPDGSIIAYIYGEGKNNCQGAKIFKINTYNLNNGQITSILNNANEPSRIDWLPGGEFAYIAMNTETVGSETIYIVDPNGNIVKQLPTNSTDFTHLLGFDFSTDGAKVAFVGDIWPLVGNETTDIYVTNLEGDKNDNLTNGLGKNLDPAWFPSGDTIAFTSDRGGKYDIYLMNSDGSGLQQITHGSGSFTNPAWRVVP